MTMFTKCLLISVLACFAGELTEAQQSAPAVHYPVQNPTALLNMPPYCSFSGFPKPYGMSDTIDQKLKHIASQTNIPLEHLYQFYAMIDQDFMSMTPDQNVNMINEMAQAIRKELDMPGASGRPPCQPYHPKMPNMPNMPNFPGMPNLNIPNFPHRQQMNMQQYQNPNLYKRDPQQGLISSLMNDMTSNLKSGYNNMLNFAEKMAPQTTESMKNVINSIVGSNAPPQDQSMADNLADKLNSNVRYMMAGMTDTMKKLF